ncbi:hypothetical protein XENOCAPTIV_023286, partial [Xenoophorus captivus]
NHHDRIMFLLTRSPEIPVILGRPWLIKHSPVINWLTDFISFLSVLLILLIMTTSFLPRPG